MPDFTGHYLIFGGNYVRNYKKMFRKEFSAFSNTTVNSKILIALGTIIRVIFKIQDKPLISYGTAVLYPFKNIFTVKKRHAHEFM